MTHKSRFATGLLLLYSLTACATTGPRAANSAPNRDTPNHPTAAATQVAEPETSGIAVEHVARTISMFYSLDLKQDNAQSPAMAQVLRAYDESVRTCFTSRLQALPQLSGDVGLTFSLSKATGTVYQIAYTGGTLRDKPLVSCVKQQLSHIPFHPPYDMHGSLHYQFQVLNNTPTVTAYR